MEQIKVSFYDNLLQKYLLNKYLEEEKVRR